MVLWMIYGIVVLYSLSRRIVVSFILHSLTRKDDDMTLTNQTQQIAIK